MSAYTRMAMLGSMVGIINEVTGMLPSVGHGTLIRPAVSFADGALSSMLEQLMLTGELDPREMLMSGALSAVLDAVMYGVFGGLGDGGYRDVGVEGGSPVNLSSDTEQHILEGQRIAGSNKHSGGHSPNINNANPNYAVQEIKVNPDGTKVVKFVTQYPDGNLSKIKTSTLFPDTWSDAEIINAVKAVGETPAAGIRSAEGLTLHRGVVNGVEIEVIISGNDIVTGYPVGGKPTTNFDPIS